MPTNPVSLVNTSFPVDFIPLNGTPQDCENCGKAERLGFQFNDAYQTIVDLERRSVFAHESPRARARRRGVMTVLSQVNDGDVCKRTVGAQPLALTLAQQSLPPRST